VVPYRMIAVTVSCTSIIVLRTGNLLYRMPGGCPSRTRRNGPCRG
jgi:hypothetical protein